MNISSINNNYNIFYNPSFCATKYKHNENLQSDELILSEDSKKQNLSFKDELKNLYNRLKISIYIISPYPTVNNIKAFFSDPIAFSFELLRPFYEEINSDEKIGEVDLQKRDKSGKIKAEIKKISFNDDSYVYSINKKGKDKEKLGYIDIYENEKNKTYFVEYAYTLTGNKKYKNILNILIQAAAEDSIRRGFIPQFKAIPTQIGFKKYDRGTLYNIMGCETQHETDIGGHEGFNAYVNVYTKEKVIKMLEGIAKSPNKTYIYNDTPEKLAALKNEM